MIYLDNSATTALSKAATDAISNAVSVYGNPSSMHAAGSEARKLIETARSQIASTFGRASGTGRVFFMASGTEANNTALFGTAYAKKRSRANKIISTNAEHPSVEEALKRLEQDGFNVVRLSTRGGVIDRDEFLRELDNTVFMISVMSVNNETGAIFDVPWLFATAKKFNTSIITHTDAVQAYLKQKIDPCQLKADLVSVSGHKIHAPKGIGVLYVSNEILKTRSLRPYIVGGGQEDGFRSGTENVIGIAAFGATAADGWRRYSEIHEKVGNLGAYAIKKLASCGVRINLPLGEGTHAANIINITLPDIKSETMLNFLSARGICVSSGSACSAHSGKVSKVLLAFGLCEADADCSLRISLDEQNEFSDIDALSDALSEGITTLIKAGRMKKNW